MTPQQCRGSRVAVHCTWLSIAVRHEEGAYPLSDVDCRALHRVGGSQDPPKKRCPSGFVCRRAFSEWQPSTAAPARCQRLVRTQYMEINREFLHLRKPSRHCQKSMAVGWKAINLSSQHAGAFTRGR